MANFQSLPTELVLQIISYLRPDQFINLSLANYTSFQSRLLVPPMTIGLFDDLCATTSLAAAAPTMMPWVMEHARFSRWTLPTEITYMVLEHLNHKEMMRFVLYQWPLLTRIFGSLSSSTRQQLHKANLQVQIASLIFRDMNTH